MDTVGYAHIRPNARGQSALPLNNFTGEICRVMEFADDGGVLVMDSKGTGLAMFETEAVMRSFKCSVSGEVICPPGLDFLGQAAYVFKCMKREGGYNSTLRDMVIVASLAKGAFHDDFLWALQKVS